MSAICRSCDSVAQYQGENDGFRFFKCSDCGFRFTETKESIVEYAMRLQKAHQIRAERPHS